MYMPPLRNANHTLTGIFLILVACAAFYLSRHLTFITEVGVGSGFIPRMFAGLQLLLGLALVASGFVSTGKTTEMLRLRPLLVLVAIIFFGLAIELMGLPVSVIGLVLIACAANEEVRLFETLCIAISSAVFSTLLFVTALGLTIPVWPQNFVGN